MTTATHTESLEDILSKITAARTNANTAQEAFSAAEAAHTRAMGDDGTLSAAELLADRQEATQRLELCRIESERAQRAYQSAVSGAEADLLALAESERVRLLTLANDRKAAILADIGKHHVDEAERVGALKRHDIAAFATDCPAVTAPAGLARQIRGLVERNTSRDPVARLQTLVTMLSQSMAMV